MYVDERWVSFNWMCWPLPHAETAWKARYASEDPNHMYYASVLDAYETLIMRTKKDRDKIISTLRRAMKERDNAEKARTATV